MDDYDETHRIIANMGGVKMRLNSHKMKIEENEPEWLIKALEAEVQELKEAIEEGNIMHIIEESGDVFNFLVGIVHQQTTLYRIRK